MQLAQTEVYYYGYWVYDDLTDTYIWFPADYVIVDGSWVEYMPPPNHYAITNLSSSTLYLLRSIFSLSDGVLRRPVELAGDCPQP